MYDIPFDRSFLQLSNGIRHVMPSTDTKPELTVKASIAQPVSQPAVYASGLISYVILNFLDLNICLSFTLILNGSLRNIKSRFYSVFSNACYVLMSAVLCMHLAY
jgi:hypothetical protein